MSFLGNLHFIDPIITNVSSKAMNFFSNIFSSIFQPDSNWWTWSILLLYAAVEINFYLVYKYHLVPQANIPTERQPVRAFGCQDGQDRFMLLRRILDRLERTCAATGEDMLQATAQYMVGWYRFEPHKDPKRRSHPKPPPMRRVSTITTDSDSIGHNSDGDDSESDSEWEDCTGRTAFTKSNGDLVWTDSRVDGCEKTNIYKWAMHTLYYDDVKKLMACFFIDKRVEDCDEEDNKVLNYLMGYLIDHFSLKCKMGSNPIVTARTLTLDDVTSWHRPLAVYAGFYAMQWSKAISLWMLGFQYNETKTGLTYWYRPASFKDAPNPLLFFHGIAPGGSTIYLPMLLGGVANDGRALFLFENKSVSCHPSFKVVSEDETIAGVQEALDIYYPKGDIGLMGHSFGSFQLTWMIYSPLRDRIRQFALLDPVSILLSEPDLIVNFEECTPLFQIFLRELWTQFYVRRHFSWHRSELWLDDLPEDVDVFFGLAESDQIVNAPKVLREVQIFGSVNPAFKRQTTTVFWPRGLHGDCLYMPSHWRDIRNFFDKANRTGQKEKVC